MSSAFASLTKSDPIPIPFDLPHTVIVRKLSGREYQRVQEAHAIGIATGDARLWSARFKRLLENSIAEKAEIERAIADPLTGFDRHMLVRLGTVAWSYQVSLKAVKSAPASEGTPAIEAYDPIDDLSDEHVDFIAREVLRRTKPALFQSIDEQEHERKNATGAFTAV
jgi:hypothetical protein